LVLRLRAQRSGRPDRAAEGLAIRQRQHLTHCSTLGHYMQQGAFKADDVCDAPDGLRMTKHAVGFGRRERETAAAPRQDHLAAFETAFDLESTAA